MVCLNIIVLGMNWSGSRCVRCPAVAGDFGPGFFFFFFFVAG